MMAKVIQCHVIGVLPVASAPVWDSCLCSHYGQTFFAHPRGCSLRSYSTHPPLGWGFDMGSVIRRVLVYPPVW